MTDSVPPKTGVGSNEPSGHCGFFGFQRGSSGGQVTDRVELHDSDDLVVHVLGDRVGCGDGVIDCVEEGQSLGLGAAGCGEIETIEADVVAAGVEDRVDEQAGFVDAVDPGNQRVAVLETERDPTLFGPVELLVDANGRGLQLIVWHAELLGVRHRCNPSGAQCARQ